MMVGDDDGDVVVLNRVEVSVDGEVMEALRKEFDANLAFVFEL